MLRRRIAALLTTALLPFLLAAVSDFSLPGVEGGALTPAALTRGDIIIVVWASWSPRCRDLGTRLQALQRSWGKDARIVSVNYQEDRKVVRAYLMDGRAVGRKTPQRFDRVLLDAPCSGEARFDQRNPKTWRYWSPKKIQEAPEKRPEAEPR